jgi:phenylpropionate dioxygenase-like ring-hydroxylating dioxygenase large terminal subunit
MAFLKNAWYVAAWSDEIGPSLFYRRILGEPVLMYRTEGGVAIAMSDRCPHRAAPLHRGSLKNDIVQCGYHGLKFDTSGSCIFNPQGSGAIPAKARVRKYRTAEHYGALWIWMGRDELADENKIPAFDFLANPDRYVTIKGYLHGNASYQLVCDNILDLSHVDFLHAQTLGCDATATARTKVLQDSNTTVRCERWMADNFQGPLLSALFERVNQRVDAWVDVRWDAPSNMLLLYGMTDVGASRAAGREIPNAHLITPEDDRSCHYFWASGRDFRVADTELTQQLQVGVEMAFVAEDKPMIEAQQQMLGASDLTPVDIILLEGDAATTRVRRLLGRLIDDELKTELNH